MADGENKEVNLEYSKMLSQVEERERFLKEKWRDDACQTWETYAGRHHESTPFNILYSNTEVLVPATYSSGPIPVVKRRHDLKRADIPAKAAESMLSYLMDTNLSGYPAFTETIESCVLDAALVDLGVPRVRVVDNLPVLDYVAFDRFVWAYSRRWEDVPWVAYALDFTKEDLIKIYKLDEAQASTLVGAEVDASGSEKDKGPATLRVWETWNKKDRKIYHLCSGFGQTKCLVVKDDPYGLVNFFPTPRVPLRFTTQTTSTLPAPLYNQYKQQAEELNALTRRIKLITQAIKVRGIYDGNLGQDLSTLLSSDDLENKLVPSSNTSGLLQDGLDRHIWLLPVEKLIMVLKELFIAREQVKMTIYEILGLGDILRGVSKASETLGAQQIKDKWGSLRLRKQQGRVSTFVRECLRLMLEAAAKRTPEDVWAQATGLQLPTAIEASVLAQSGQPPQMSWPQLLQTLQNDLTRSYIIDIETNSTVEVEATDDREQVAEFMNALGQTLAGIGPLAQQGPQGFEAAKALLLSVCKRFRLGQEVEGALEALTPQAAGGNIEEQKKQVEEAMKSADKMLKEAQAAEKAAKSEGDKAVEARRQVELKIQDLNFVMKELKLERREIELAKRAAVVEVQTKAQAATTPPKPAKGAS